MRMMPTVTGMCSEGLIDLCHFLSAALRLVCSNRRISLNQGWDWEDRAGLVDRGHSLSRQELSVEHKDSVASFTSSEEKVLEGGRAEATSKEKWVGERFWRLRQKETMRVGVVVGSGRHTLN